MKALFRLTGACALAALIQGCAATDPLLNQNDWNPIGANAQNIAAQVANPEDLTHGRASSSGSDGEMASNAVLRLRTGHVKPLPDSGISQLKIQASSSSAGGN